jgi:hypothetical protein
MADNIVMLSDGRSAMYGAFILVWLICGISQTGRAQLGPGDQSWTTSSEQKDPSGAVNPTRTSTSHSEVNGRVVEKTVVEALGPDGRYIPYSEIERESVRVNDTTVRNVERSYGRTPDGQRTLTQETQEESRSFPDGARRVNRTISNPDGNGGLQVVQRALIDSKQISRGIRETNTTLFSADGSGGLAATVRITERERQTDAMNVEFTKSTSLLDGAGHWAVSEVREGTSRQEPGGGSTKEERVLRPDASGKLAVAERTVSKESVAGKGEKSDITETYSTNVPGQAGDGDLRLVRRESTVQRTNASGARSTTERVEQPNPGDPGAGLHVTQEAIDIVRPGANGVAAQSRTILAPDSNGQLKAVWVDMGKTDNPAAVKVDTAPAKKAK